MNDRLSNQNVSQTKDNILYKDENCFEKPESGVRYHFWYDAGTALHTHNFFEFFIITEGEITHYYNGQYEHLHAGVMCLIKPGDVHQFLKDENVKAVHFNFSITQSLFSSICNALSKFLYLTLCNTTTLIRYQLQETEFSYFLHLISQLHSIPQENSIGKSAIIKTLLQNLLLCLLNQENNNKSFPQWFIEFINKLHLPEYFVLPISQLYKLVHYSQPRLNSYFHQYTQSTLVAYVTKLRINYSCNLLTFSDYSITAISGMAGYNSLSHYNHTFKKMMGTSPANYRKNTNNKKKTYTE